MFFVNKNEQLRQIDQILVHLFTKRVYIFLTEFTNTTVYFLNVMQLQFKYIKITYI